MAQGAQEHGGDLLSQKAEQGEREGKEGGKKQGKEEGSQEKREGEGEVGQSLPY